MLASRLLPWPLRAVAVHLNNLSCIDKILADTLESQRAHVTGAWLSKYLLEAFRSSYDSKLGFV